MSRYRNLLIVTTLAILWSWLLLVEVTQLSSSKVLGYALAFVAFAVIVILSAVAFAVAVRYLSDQYRKERSSAWFLVQFLFVWAVTELVVSWLVSIIWLGRGGSVDTVLPFGSFTPLLMYTPLGFLARIVGYHGLSAVFVVVVGSLMLKRTRKFAPLVIGIVVVMTVISWRVYATPNGETIKAKIVAEHLDSKVSTINTDADIVVFPEYGLDGIDDDKIPTRLKAEGPEDVYFTGSKQVSGDGGVQNILMFGSVEKGYLSQSAKARLIPGGEYLPYSVDLVLNAVGADSVLDNFDFARAVAKGSSQARPFTVREDVVIGAEACASIISAEDYRGLVRQGSTLLVNAASLEIFNSVVFNIQHKGLGKFMAVANARPMLQSANSGAAFALDHNGQTLDTVQPVDSADVEISTNNRKTPYTYLGEWISLVGLVLLAVSAARYWYDKRFKKPDSVN